MQYGPDASVKCPACGTKARYRTLLSGNTFGAIYWTDGKREAPMLDVPPPFVRCKSCSKFYWLRDVINGERTETASTNSNADYIVGATEGDMYAALNAGQIEKGEDEKQLRILAWWLSNDPYRRTGQTSPITNEALAAYRVKNLQSLLQLLNTSDNEKLMKAEILRELGLFKAARLQLDTVSDSRYSKVVEQFRALCDAGDRQVRQLNLR
jgi:hypothetical protein